MIVFQWLYIGGVATQCPTGRLETDQPLAPRVSIIRLGLRALAWMRFGGYRALG